MPVVSFFSDDKQVLVFSTDLNSSQQAEAVRYQLTRSGLADRVAFDLDDCDRVLRVETDAASAGQIEQSVRELGVTISEMAD